MHRAAHQGDPLEHVLHRGPGTYHLVRRRRRWLRAPPRWATLAALQRPVHRLQGLIEIERLGEVIERAPLDRTHRRVEIAERGHDDDRRIVRHVAELSQGVQAVHSGETDIEQDRVRRLLRHQREGRLRRRRRRDLVSLGRDAPVEATSKRLPRHRPPEFDSRTSPCGTKGNLDPEAGAIARSRPIDSAPMGLQNLPRHRKAEAHPLGLARRERLEEPRLHRRRRRPGPSRAPR